MSNRVAGAAPGYTLRGACNANKINQLPDHEFAQLDAHNSFLFGSITQVDRVLTTGTGCGLRFAGIEVLTFGVMPLL